MEIQAKLSFKHGRIMRVLNENGLSIKDLSIMAGWDYQACQAFVNFKRIPRKSNRDNLFNALYSLDPDITYEEIFPEQYDKIKDILQPKVSIQDIPLKNLLPYNTDFIPIEDNNYKSVELTKDMEQLLKIIEKHCNKRSYDMLCMYYGKEMTYQEVGKAFQLTTERVRGLIKKALEHAKLYLYNYENLLD